VEDELDPDVIAVAGFGIAEEPNMPRRLFRVLFGDMIE
jgi:hypothetical protein